MLLQKRPYYHEIFARDPLDVDPALLWLYCYCSEMKTICIHQAQTCLHVNPLTINTTQIFPQTLNNNAKVCTSVNGLMPLYLYNIHETCIDLHIWPYITISLQSTAVALYAIGDDLLPIVHSSLIRWMLLMMLSIHIYINTKELYTQSMPMWGVLVLVLVLVLALLWMCFNVMTMPICSFAYISNTLVASDHIMLNAVAVIERITYTAFTTTKPCTRR